MNKNDIKQVISELKEFKREKEKEMGKIVEKMIDEARTRFGIVIFDMNVEIGITHFTQCSSEVNLSLVKDINIDFILL